MSKALDALKIKDAESRLGSDSIYDICKCGHNRFQHVFDDCLCTAKNCTCMGFDLELAAIND